MQLNADKTDIKAYLKDEKGNYEKGNYLSVKAQKLLKF